MRCRTCDYTLFDIRQRTCPECGSPFKPSDFDFHQSAVRFCCPHCDQDYYGTDERGHLVPRAFDCVKCKRPITMDEMIVQPTTGIAEERTQQDPVPWNDKRRRRWAFTRFFSTIGWSMGRPIPLGRALQREPRVGRALFFSCIIATASGAWLLPIVLLGAMGRSNNSIIYDILPGVAIFIAVCTLGTIVFVLLWSLVAHAIIRVGNPPHRTIGTTISTVAYCTGPAILVAFPCLGVYAPPVVLLWSMICLAFALKAAHECSTTRGILAAITVPLLVATTAVSLIIAFIVPEFMRVRSSATIVPPPPPITAPAPVQALPAPQVTPAEPPMDQPATPPAPHTPETQDKPHVPETPQP